MRWTHLVLAKMDGQATSRRLWYISNKPCARNNSSTTNGVHGTVPSIGGGVSITEKRPGEAAFSKCLSTLDTHKEGTNACGAIFLKKMQCAAEVAARHR